MLFYKGKDSAPSPTKKLSLSSLLSLQSSSDVDDSPSPSSSESSSPLSLSISHEDLSGTDDSSVNSCEDEYFEDEDDDDDRTDRFREKHYLSTRHGMKLHPYHGEAPYMQAYEPMLLENDRYTDALLRRLNPTGTPTFRAPLRPPARVLDLGCGQGRWVIDAATVWKEYGTKCIGFDLVDLSTDFLKKQKLSPENVEFVRGNFVKYDLPFPDDSFDLVRMANLSLCIPYDRWEFVLGQVRRVLTPGGRLEFIDDEILFPYDNLPMPQSFTQFAPSATRSDTSSFASSFDTDEDEYSFDEGIDVTAPIDDIESVLERPILSPTLDSSAQWESQVNVSKDLETTFAKMLEHSGIHSSTSTFIRDLLNRTFGRRNVNKVSSMHLSLAPRDQQGGDKDSDVASMKSSDSGFSSCTSSSGKKPWITIEWDKKDKKGDKKEKRERKKLRKDKKRRLKERASDDSLATESLFDGSQTTDSKSSISSSPARVQSQGLVIWPSTFIPLEPYELEMHVCKHMHVLLGCRPALAEYIAEFKDEDGERLVGDREFNDLLWAYESFRRDRFNWPSEIPEMSMDQTAAPRKPTPDSPIFGRKRSNSNPFNDMTYYRDDLTHVRTIRVFEAFKTDDDTN